MANLTFIRYASLVYAMKSTPVSQFHNVKIIMPHFRYFYDDELMTP